jgi:hypothetical protein
LNILNYDWTGRWTFLYISFFVIDQEGVPGMYVYPLLWLVRKVNLMYMSFILIGQDEEECEGPPVLPSVRELKHKFRVSNPDLKTQV